MVISMTTLWLVIPCYNEEAVIGDTASQLFFIMRDLIGRGKISDNSKIVFINDGSKDKTWEIIEMLYKENHVFAGINLLKNAGQQNALMAGLMTARAYADAVITLDADLQDDIKVIENFVDKHKQGYDVVYGIREDRRSDCIGKRVSAQFFYTFIKFMNPRIIHNHGDFRLMSRSVLDSLCEYQTDHLFLRGIVAQLDYPAAMVSYKRKKRMNGVSKYSLIKMMTLALNGFICAYVGKSHKASNVRSHFVPSYEIEKFLYEDKDLQNARQACP